MEIIIFGKKNKIIFVKELLSSKKKAKNKILQVITGLLAGTVNGLFGGGGGMIVVPMLGFLLGYDKKTAHATAILIILPISLISGLIYGITGYFDASVAIPVIIGTVTGGAVGAVFLSRISSKFVAVIFSALMMFAGVKTAFF